MSAVEVGGQQRSLVSYRLAAKLNMGSQLWQIWGPLSVEVAVSPDAQSIPGIVLLVAISSSFQRTYFYTEQGGG